MHEASHSNANVDSRDWNIDWYHEHIGVWSGWSGFVKIERRAWHSPRYFESDMLN
jgi:hypothetical protein